MTQGEFSALNPANRSQTASTRAMDGVPANGRGRKPRCPEPATPAQDTRQTRAFEMHLDGSSVSEIAVALGISRNTAAIDIQMESKRRSTEIAKLRDIRIAESVARYEGVILRANRRLAELDFAEKTSASLREANRCERSIIEAQTRIDIALGLVESP